MRIYRGTPNSVQGETANLIMFGKELRLPNQLHGYPPPTELQYRLECVLKTKERLQNIYVRLQWLQFQTRHFNGENHFYLLLERWYGNGKMWQKKGSNSKLQPKFIRPYQVNPSFPNNTYLVERLGPSSIQNECHPKSYHHCNAELGLASATIEPRRIPNMRGCLQGSHRNQICNSTIPPINLDGQPTLQSRWEATHDQSTMPVVNDNSRNTEDGMMSNDLPT